MLLDRTLQLNSIVFVVLLAIPLGAELITVAPNDVSGTGFDVLLYWPFDFAYVALAAVLLILTNALSARKRKRSVLLGAAIGVILTAVWLVVTFLSVAQLHLSLGGKLEVDVSYNPAFHPLHTT